MSSQRKVGKLRCSRLGCTGVFILGGTKSSRQGMPLDSHRLPNAACWGSRLPARSVLLNAFAVQRSPPATPTPKPLLNSSLVLANFVSFASPQAARLTHFVARPLPTQPDLLGLRGVPLELAARSCERFGTRQAQRPLCSLPCFL